MFDEMKIGKRIPAGMLTLALGLMLVLGMMAVLPSGKTHASVATHKLTVTFETLDVNGKVINESGGNAWVTYTRVDGGHTETFAMTWTIDIDEGFPVIVSYNQSFEGYKYVDIRIDDDEGWVKDDRKFITTSLQKDATVTLVFQRQKTEMSFRYEAPKCGNEVKNSFDTSGVAQFLGQTPDPKVVYETAGCSAPEDKYDDMLPRLIKKITGDYCDFGNIFSGTLTGDTECYIFIPVQLKDEEDFDIRENSAHEKEFYGTASVNGKPAKLVEYPNSYVNTLFVIAEAEIQHNWGTGKVTKKATATAAGVKTYTCTACGATKTAAIPKLAKKANSLKVKGKTAKVKYSKLKKKNQKLTVTKVIKFTRKGQGKMSYKLVSAKKGKKSFKKKFLINKKTGKVTVKKGLRKGTYNVKVRVKAAGNANYKASAWKTVTFKVRVR